MLIDIRAKGFIVTDAIRRYVEARLDSALRPFSKWVLKATVRMVDVNAGRGGEDKRCRIVVALRRHGIQIAEATNADLYTSVDKVAARIRRSVRRATERDLARERHDPRRPGAVLAF